MDNSDIITGPHPPELRQAAADLRRNMTPAERLLWQRLRASRLGGYHFRRQQIIGRFIVDFYCHAAGLVVEVDGEVHSRQTHQDAERARELTARGLRVLRFANAEVMHDTERVCREILRAAQEHLTPWPPSLTGKGEPKGVGCLDKPAQK